MSSTYTQDGLSAFGNLAWVETAARDIDSPQFLFGNDELAYISHHDIKLDHEASTRRRPAVATRGRTTACTRDCLYGSGLRNGFVNTEHEKPYYPVNVGWEHVFPLDCARAKSRESPLRRGQRVRRAFTSCGAARAWACGAPQWGQRRTSRRPDFDF